MPGSTPQLAFHFFGFGGGVACGELGGDAPALADILVGFGLTGALSLAS